MAKKVAVVVPAYNEAARISSVLRAVTQAKIPAEIIVVSDGSIDGTAKVASRYPDVKVIELSSNKGKGAAMLTGVKATDADIIAFIDADLVGLRPDHVDAIIRPLLQGACDMCVGVFRGGKFWSDSAQKVAPHLSGQRCMARELFLGVPHLVELRLGVEVAINAYVRRKKARVVRVILRGVANYHKEKKLGLVQGSKARLQMWGEIATAMMRYRQKKSRSTRKWR